MSRAPGGRTLLASLLLSAPGPVAVGIGVLLGRSSTQLADFVRRTAELAAIAVSWAVYRRAGRDGMDPARKARLERRAALGVGLAMCLGGAAMAALAFLPRQGETGNVTIGLVIAILGVLTNGWFWRRYARLDRAGPDAILAAQATLYRAKFVVDLFVTAALLTVALRAGSRAALLMDAAGSLTVAIYLLVSGAGVLRGARRGVAAA
ncbi:MAG TPA: cation transporter [Candidatus Limnocylindria bacterium]|nr:cation transporter [Candidatus Limnocylindria bacterium]